MSADKVTIKAIEIDEVKLEAKEPMDAILGDYAPLLKKVLEGGNSEIALTDNIKILRKYAFSGYDAMTTFVSSSVSKIYDYAFNNCTSLSCVVLKKKDAIVELLGSNVFTETPIINGEGYIYVPSSLATSYKTASYWSAYADKIRSIEDYPDVGG